MEDVEEEIDLSANPKGAEIELASFDPDDHVESMGNYADQSGLLGDYSTSRYSNDESREGLKRRSEGGIKREETEDDCVGNQLGNKRMPGMHWLPVTQNNFVYIAFGLLGAGFLFPYYSFITAVDYFTMRYPTRDVEFYFSAASIYSTLFWIFVNTRLVHRFRLVWRVRFGYMIFLPVLLFIPLLDILWEGGFVKEAWGYPLTLVVIAIVGLGNGVQQGSYYGYTGVFPVRHTQALMTGEGLAGSLVSFNRVITKAIFDRGDDPSSYQMNATDLDSTHPETQLTEERRGLIISTYVYFGFSTCLIAICWILFEKMRKLPYSQHYMKMAEKSRVDESTVRNAQDDASIRAIVDEEVPIKLSAWKLFLKIKRPALLVFFVYFITNLLFPGPLTLAESSDLGDWYPIILITLFNVCDTFGKIASSYHSFVSFTPPSPKYKRTLILILGRVVFVPWVYLCIAPLGNPVFKNEGILIVAVILFALTNGYFGSTAMMLGPDLVDPIDKEAAGSMMAFILLFGLAAGASVALIFNYLVHM